MVLAWQILKPSKLDTAALLKYSFFQMLNLFTAFEIYTPFAEGQAKSRC